MAFSLTWLAQVLRDAGLKVAEQPGWQDRGRGDVGETLGVICHHTAGGKDGNMPSLGVLINGRPDLAGPLAQLGLGRDGTFYVIRWPMQSRRWRYVAGPKDGQLK